MDDPGVRFQPTDEELVVHYLEPKIKGLASHAPQYVLERDLYGDNNSPWVLFDDNKDPWQTTTLKDRTERNIYVITQLKQASKSRISRVAGCGVWHGEVGPQKICDDEGQTVGIKKTFCFEVTTDEVKTDGILGHWIMHEFSSTRMGTEEANNNKKYVICKISRDDSKPLRRVPEWRRPKNNKATNDMKRARPCSETSNDLLQKEKKLKRNHNVDTNEDDGGLAQLLATWAGVEEAAADNGVLSGSTITFTGSQQLCQDQESSNGSNFNNSVLVNTSQDINYEDDGGLAQLQAMWDKEEEAAADNGVLSRSSITQQLCRDQASSSGSSFNNSVLVNTSQDYSHQYLYEDHNVPYGTQLDEEDLGLTFDIDQLFNFDESGQQLLQIHQQEEEG